VTLYLVSVVGCQSAKFQLACQVRTCLKATFAFLFFFLLHRHHQHTQTHTHSHTHTHTHTHTHSHTHATSTNDIDTGTMASTLKASVESVQRFFGKKTPEEMVTNITRSVPLALSQAQCNNALFSFIGTNREPDTTAHI